MSGGWTAGLKTAGAAALATKRVNADKSLLPGRVLEFSWADSACSAKQGLAAMGELLGGDSRVNAVIGPGCSAACEVTSHLSGGQSIPQISWGWYARRESPFLMLLSCMGVCLQHKPDTLGQEHIRAGTCSTDTACCVCIVKGARVCLQFSRTVAPETSHGPALIAMWRLYAWERAVILSTTESLWFESALGLAKQLGAAGIEVLKPSAFETGSFNAAILREIKRSTIRIVMLCAYDPDMLEIASKADTEGMTSVGWAWVLTEGIVANLPERILGWLYIQPLLLSKGMQAFAEQVSEYSKSRFNITVDADSIDLTYSQTLYDAVMLYAHAATKVLSEGGDLRDGQAVTAAVRSTTFEGVGGSALVLDENGDRVESYEIMNYVVGADGAISGVPVGKYDSTERQYTAYERAVVWPGSTMEVPKDMEDTRREGLCLLFPP